MVSMKTKKSLFEKIYDRDPASRAVIIKTSIDHYTDIFNDLDPAPFKTRDIAPDLRLYLEDCSTDIPLKHDIVMQFDAPKSIKDNDKEKKVISGLNTYFQFLMRTYKRDISSAYKKSIVYIVTSLILLSFAFYLTSIIPEDFLFVTLVEGLYIGGWVFLWEAMALFVFKNREIKLKFRRYERLYKASISFNYV